VCPIVCDLEISKGGGLGPIWTATSQKKKWDTILGNSNLTSKSESKKGTGAQLRQ
jgi:hypothetical protein